MKEKNTKQNNSDKKAIGLTTKIFIALIAGAILVSFSAICSGQQL